MTESAATQKLRDIQILTETLRVLMLQLRDLTHESPLAPEDQTAVNGELQVLFNAVEENIKPVRVAYVNRIRDLLADV